MNVVPGSSKRAHIPLTEQRRFNFSSRSWLHCLITMLIPASVTLRLSHTANSSKCMHL